MKKILAILLVLIGTNLFAQNRALRIDSLEINDKNVTAFFNDLMSTDLMKIVLDSLMMFSVTDSADTVHMTDNGTNFIIDSENPVLIENILDVDTTASIGTWGYTGEHIIIPQSSDNTNAGLGVYSMVNYNPTAGKVFAGAYNRALAMTTNQTNLATIVGTESQFRLRDVSIGNGVHAGLWAYAEQSGTSVLSGGGTFDAISATVESESGFSVGATEHVTGLTLDSSINGSATINASANFTGLYIKSNGKDWFNGIWTTGCANDWKLRNGATIDNTDENTLTITESTVNVNGDLVVSNALKMKTYYDDDIDDDDTYNLPDGAFGHGIVFISNDTNEEGGTFGFYDDNPCLISVSANCQEADADNKLVIMDGGDTVAIKNTLGDNYKLTLIIWYYIP